MIIIIAFIYLFNIILFLKKNIKRIYNFASKVNKIINLVFFIFYKLIFFLIFIEFEQLFNNTADIYLTYRIKYVKTKKV